MKTIIKKVVFWSWVCSQFMTSSTALADIAPAGELATVAGKAQFVKKQAVVPMCVNCGRSKPYWALVLTGFETSYEFQQAFAVGSDKAPDAVEIRSKEGDVVVRPGSRIQVRGRVAPVARSRKMITEVDAINHMMDGPTVFALDGSADVGPVSVDPHVGWTCLSEDRQPLPPGRKIYAEVSYGTHSNGRGRGYRMNVLVNQEGDPRSFDELAAIEPVKPSNRQFALVYEGQTKKASAELVIQPESPRDDRQPSVLTLFRMIKSGDSRMPVQTVVEMRCAPARFIGLN